MYLCAPLLVLNCDCSTARLKVLLECTDTTQKRLAGPHVCRQILKHGIGSLSRVKIAVQNTVHTTSSDLSFIDVNLFKIKEIGRFIKKAFERFGIRDAGHEQLNTVVIVIGPTQPFFGLAETLIEQAGGQR